MNIDVNLSRDDRDCILDAIKCWLDNHTQEEPDDDTFRVMRRLERKFILLTPWRVL